MPLLIWDFLEATAQRSGVECQYTAVDTVPIARNLLPELRNHKLDTVAKALDCREFNHHRACDDAAVLAEIFVKLCRRMQEENNIHTTLEINTRLSGCDVKKGKSFHQIILVKNKVGLKTFINWYHMAI